jgi:hypothetical protein
VRFRPSPPKPKFDLAASARGYPVSRVLKYLDLQYPVEGLATGSFPIVGTGDAVTGGGSVTLRDAVMWGQKVSSASGKLVFEPGRVAIDDVRASIGAGVVGGSLS